MYLKILVELYVPEIEEQYELYIPVNKTVGYCIKQIKKMLKEHYEELSDDLNVNLYNKRTGQMYSNNILIRNTNIRNGSQLALLTI
ncbi:hypothetical protein IIZ81_02840 [Candidatus Saccharibacteria bacterium]|nr:hypothetical protein [Candidatus Saccharibacteria bacterium]